MTTPTPPAVATLAPPPVGSGYTTVLNGHFSVGGQRVAFPGVNFDASCVWGICNPKAGVLQVDPAQQTVYAAEADRLLKLGVRHVRVLGLDASNINPIFAAGTTLKFDPGKSAALKWWLSQLSQRGIYYSIPLHYKRYLRLADLGPNPSALALECVAQSWQGAAGQTPPWGYFDSQTLQPLQMQFDTMIADLVGDDQAFVGYELENENPVVKAAQWSFSATTKPALEGARAAAFAAWSKLNSGLTGQTAVNKFWSDTETAVQRARIANLRTIQPNALFTVNTFYGDGPFAMLASSLNVGDYIAGHVYTGNAVTDGPGFYVGQPGSTTDQRSRLACVAGCCRWTKPSTGQEMPTVISEYGPQFQCTGNPFDQEQYLAGDILTAAWQMVRADVEGCNLYSWAANAIWAGGVSAKNGPYDLRNVPEISEAIAAANAVFVNPAYRPTTEVVVQPTGGLYGQSSPYNEPALRALPIGTKVVMQSAA